MTRDVPQAPLAAAACWRANDPPPPLPPPAQHFSRCGTTTPRGCGAGAPYSRGHRCPRMGYEHRVGPRNAVGHLGGGPTDELLACSAGASICTATTASGDSDPTNGHSDLTGSPSPATHGSMTELELRASASSRRRRFRSQPATRRRTPSACTPPRQGGDDGARRARARASDGPNGERTRKSDVGLSKLVDARPRRQPRTRQPARVRRPRRPHPRDDVGRGGRTHATTLAEAAAPTRRRRRRAI